MRKPDFDNILKILKRENPDRPTLFEFCLNDKLNERLCGYPLVEGKKGQGAADAYAVAGYDYCTMWNYGFYFKKADMHRAKSISLNAGNMINSWEDFEKYPWPDVDNADYSQLSLVKLQDGMKIIVQGPGGVQETLIALIGYDNLCMMLFDEPELVKAVVDRVGSCLVRHYERCLEHDQVGACISNDDWGFQQQTMLSPEHTRELIVPWHVKIVEAIHSAGRPAILHSCGNTFDNGLVNDVIDVCKYDARHSYEDKILKVEDAYERYGKRIAILGGIDLDFLCRKTPEEIHKRACALLEQTAGRGGYALGSGNSIPDYVPFENYFAMISAATGMDYSKFI